MQHATFDQVQTDATKRTTSPEADCSLDTKIPFPDPAHPTGVETLLSEISAETSEFPVYFKNIANQANPGHALEDAERRLARDPGESLQGAMQMLKCGCSCATAEKFATQAVNFTIVGWPADQTLAYLKAMTHIMPSDWPAALQRK